MTVPAGMEAAEAIGVRVVLLLLRSAPRNTLHWGQGDCLGLWVLNLGVLQLKSLPTTPVHWAPLLVSG